MGMFGYFVEIQRKLTLRPNLDIEGDEGDENIEYKDDISIHVGNVLEPAYDVFKMIVFHNLKNKKEREELVYIRFKFDPDGNSGVILSRKTPHGMGDW